MILSRWGYGGDSAEMRTLQTTFGTYLNPCNSLTITMY